MTPLTPDPVTPMSNGTPRHRRQASLRVTFADEYQGNVNCNVIYYCDVGDDVIDGCDVTSDAPVQTENVSGESVKRSTSTESHDNPFLLDGELQRKADFILQHSTISRRSLTIADPDQVRPGTETTDQVRTITGIAEPGRVELIHVSLNHDQSVANGINHKAISGKEREQEPEEVCAGGMAPPGVNGSVSYRGRLIEDDEFMVEHRLAGDEYGFTVENRFGERDKNLFTVENRFGESDENLFTVKHRIGTINENGSAVERRFEGREESSFTVDDHRVTGDVIALTEESNVRKTIEATVMITEAERTRQCCRIQ